VSNGLADLSLDPRIGVLSDPSANYTSEETIEELLDIAAEEVRLETAAMMKQANVFTLTLDESTCNSNLSQLLIYSNQLVPLVSDSDMKEPQARLLECVELSVDVEPTLTFARDYLDLPTAVMKEYEKPGGITMKGGLNQLYHLFKLKQRPCYRDALNFKKTGGVAADGTSSNTGWRRGFFVLLQQLVSKFGGRIVIFNNCLAHRFALVMSSTAKFVPYINDHFQPLLEEFFRFISNSAVRHKALQSAFRALDLDEVAVLCAFFTRWMSHGRCVMNMHKGLAGYLTGLKTIAENKHDADCAKAAGLRYQMGTFKFIMTVALLFDMFEPIDIYKKQLQARGQTHADNVAHYRACSAKVEAMRASVEQCPAQLQFVEQIKTNQVTSEYVRELEGVDTTSESAVSTFVGRQGVQFDQEVRGPFLSTTLKEMHERIEDEAMATLCAIDRIVLPVDVLDFPTRITEFKKKAAKELRKQTKLAAADALLRKAQELAAAAEVDTL
jgi:hypothetical protein